MRLAGFVLFLVILVHTVGATLRWMILGIPPFQIYPFNTSWFYAVFIAPILIASLRILIFWIQNRDDEGVTASPNLGKAFAFVYGAMALVFLLIERHDVWDFFLHLVRIR